MHTRLREAIQGGKGVRIRMLFDTLGYTPQELAAHIERKFKRGMTWERFNAGEIHIDHIVPVSAFDLSNPIEVVKCWSLSNLQPLWAKDNMVKGAKLPSRM